MRNKKLPEFTFLLEQFFTEYMPLHQGFPLIPSDPTSILSVSCSSTSIRSKRKKPVRYCSGIWIMRQLTDSYGG